MNYEEFKNSEGLSSYGKRILDNIFKAMYTNYNVSKEDVETLLSKLTEEEFIKYMNESLADVGEVMCISMTTGFASKRMFERLRALGNSKQKGVV